MDPRAEEREPQAADDASLAIGALDALPAHVAILDETATILLVNDAWRRFGEENGLADPAAGVGTNYLAVCEASDDDPHARDAAAAIRDLIEGRIMWTSFEYPCHSPDEKRWFIFRGSRFVHHGATYLVVGHDNITQRREAEENLQDSHDALEAFHLAVSHDLRAPLRRVEELARLAQLETTIASDATAREILHRIEAEARRARDLANDVLELSRVGALTPRREPVDLSAVAEEIATALQATDPERHVEWTIQPGLGTEFDSRIARVVLSNLLANAWKFTAERDPGRIEVAAEGDELLVRDNGIGFAAADADRLFAPFVRLPQARDYEGTGMGLAIVRRALERAGGSIRAEGHPGKGATFFVQFA